MENLANIFINDHKNPIVKLKLGGKKLFLKSDTPEEAELNQHSQQTLQNIFKYNRVEKRNSRTIAIWDSQRSIAILTKVTKSLLKQFGYQNKTGAYLYPEEALFLLEINRLELLLDGVPLSIQQAYSLIVSCAGLDLNRYLVYKKIAVAGYRVIRREEYNRKSQKSVVDSKESSNTQHDITSKSGTVESDIKESVTDNELSLKRKCEEGIDDSDCKKVKADVTDDRVEAKYISDVFERLRLMAPQNYSDTNEELIPDYYVYFISGNGYKDRPDFRVFIRNSPVTAKTSSTEFTDIFAICDHGEIGLYKFTEVNIVQ